MGYHIIEVELDRKGDVVSRNVSPVQFSTRDEAEAMARNAAGSLAVHGYSHEGGYWWARDRRRVNYRFFVKAQ